MATDFADWSDELDTAIANRIVGSLRETPDNTRLDWYEQGLSPDEAALAALTGTS